MSTILTPTQARRQIWESGNIVDFILDVNQKEVYTQYKTSKRKRHIAVFARQMGKSFGLLTIADQECRLRPGITVCYIAPRLNQAKKIVRSTFTDLHRTCPVELRPKYMTQESAYVYPNGSRIEMSGFNAGEIEAMRGPKAHLIIVDECGFMTDLKYGLRSVLTPKLNSTKGSMLLCSTLPKSAAHEYWEFVKRAEFDGTLFRKDIYQCPRYTKEDIEGFAEEMGGFDSIDFRREFLNEMITDQESAVFPEATEEKLATITSEHKRPAFYDSYVSMDIGFRDYTAVLFAYYDFIKGKVIIEDEILLKGNKVTTTSLTTLVKAKELDLFGAKKPYLRISDNNNPIFLNELAMAPHDLSFMPTAKDNKEAAISKVRLLIQQEKLVVNPRCKNLINHLKYATWNSKRTGFDRDLQNGHFDAADAIIYMIRNINFQKNPYPNSYFLPEGTLWDNTEKNAPKNEFEKSMKEMFNPFSKKTPGKKL
jgi:hypothetical protein